MKKKLKPKRRLRYQEGGSPRDATQVSPTPIGSLKAWEKYPKVPEHPGRDFVNEVVNPFIEFGLSSGYPSGNILTGKKALEYLREQNQSHIGNPIEKGKIPYNDPELFNDVRDPKSYIYKYRTPRPTQEEMDQAFEDTYQINQNTGSTDIQSFNQKANELQSHLTYGKRKTLGRANFALNNEDLAMFDNSMDEYINKNQDFFDFRNDRIGEGMQYKGKDISSSRRSYEQRGIAQKAVNYTWAPWREDFSPAGLYGVPWDKGRIMTELVHSSKNPYRAIDAYQDITPYQFGGIIKDNQGQYNHPGKPTRISSNNITMKNIKYPVYGKPDKGSPQMMYPNQNYFYPDASYVDEFPVIMRSGGPSAAKAREMLHNPPHGKPLTDRQRRYFGYLSNHQMGGGMGDHLNVFPMVMAYGGDCHECNKMQSGGSDSQFPDQITYPEQRKNDFLQWLRDTSYEELHEQMHNNPLDLDDETMEEMKKGGWIQKATASIKRRGTAGKCTPISKPGCTGRARALALTFKKMARNRKKHGDGGEFDYQVGGAYNPWWDYIPNTGQKSYKQLSIAPMNSTMTDPNNIGTEDFPGYTPGPRATQDTYNPMWTNEDLQVRNSALNKASGNLPMIQSDQQALGNRNKQMRDIANLPPEQYPSVSSKTVRPPLLDRWWMNPDLINAGMAGATNFIDNLPWGDNTRRKKQLRDRTHADNLWSYSQGSRGDYTPNYGYFRPDQHTAVQFPGMAGFQQYKHGGNVPPFVSPGPNSRQFPIYWPSDDWTVPSTDVRSSIEPAEEGEGTMEAEGGETIFVPDVNGLPAHYDVTGSRHSSGGVDLNVPPNSFVFSDTRDMKIGGEILQHFGKSKDTKKKYTPADLAKQYDINKFRKQLQDPDSDDYQRETAEMMIANYNKKLGMLALVSESKKGFPDGIPQIAMPYLITAAVEPESVLPLKGQEIMQNNPSPQMKYGGNWFMDNGYQSGGSMQSRLNQLKNERYRQQAISDKMFREKVGAIHNKQIEHSVKSNIIAQDQALSRLEGEMMLVNNENQLQEMIDRYQKLLARRNQLADPSNYTPTGNTIFSLLAPAKLTPTSPVVKPKPELDPGMQEWQQNPDSSWTQMYGTDSIMTPAAVPQDTTNPIQLAQQAMLNFPGAHPYKDTLSIYTAPASKFNTVLQTPVDSDTLDLSTMTPEQAAKKLGLQESYAKKQYGGLPKAQYGNEGKVVKTKSGYYVVRNGRLVPSVAPKISSKTTKVDLTGYDPGYSPQWFADLNTQNRLNKNFLSSMELLNEDAPKLQHKSKSSIDYGTRKWFSDPKHLEDFKRRNQWYFKDHKDWNPDKPGAFKQFEDASITHDAELRISPYFRSKDPHDPWAADEKPGIHHFLYSGDVIKTKEAIPGMGYEHPPFKVPTAVYNQAAAEAPWWLQDVIQTAGAADDFLSLKKYLPWAPKIAPYLPEATFYDPTRALANNTEQMAIGTQGAGVFADPQQYSSRFTGIQGHGAKNAVDIMADYDNRNVGVANQFAPIKADTLNKANEFNANTAKDLFDKVTIANQQYDNSKRELRSNLRDSYISAITNRADLQRENYMYPEFYVSGPTGGLGFPTGRPRNPFFMDPRFNSLANPGQSGEEWVNQHQNMTEEQKRAWDVYNNINDPRDDYYDARTEAIRRGYNRPRRSYP